MLTLDVYLFFGFSYLFFFWLLIFPTQVQKTLEKQFQLIVLLKFAPRIKGGHKVRTSFIRALSLLFIIVVSLGLFNTLNGNLPKNH